jgi:hypothetical protein
MRPAAADAADGGAPMPARGYWLVGSDGGVFSFGRARFFGSTGSMVLNKPIVATAATPSGFGYWILASDGGVFSFGDAGFYGSTGAMTLNRPIVGMTPTPTGLGYWLVATDGGIFAFGDAGFYGSTGAMTLNRPIVGMTPTPTGLGYWLVATDGGIFAFGDASYFGSTGNKPLNRPIVGMAPTPTGLGYRLVATDGGIFAFGDAGYYGSTGNKPLNRPIVGMAPTPTGLGYWLVATDGGIFAFGDAAYFGSTGAMTLNRPIVGMAVPPQVVAPEVSIFYYPWHATQPHDGFWHHWQSNGHDPPNDIGSNFWPTRGLYSNRDPVVLDAQFTDMAGAGIDVAISSWWGRNSYEDSVLPGVTNAARAHGVRVAIHLEPYAGRSPASVADDIRYLNATYGITDFYVYEMNRSPVADWAAAAASLSGVRVLAQSGNITRMRSGAFADDVRAAGFSGVYTYDAIRYSTQDFAAVCTNAHQFNGTRAGSALAVVAPEGGQRYDNLWAGAIDAGDFVSITSYNEWHEGTQIEPATRHCFPDGYCSDGYELMYGKTGVAAERAFLDRTAEWSATFKRA